MMIYNEIATTLPRVFLDKTLCIIYFCSPKRTDNMKRIRMLIISIAALFVFINNSHAAIMSSGDSIVKHRIDPFHFDSNVWVTHNDSIHERDERDGLMFKILAENTVEFADYRNDTIRFDSLVIPEKVSINNRQYDVVGIGGNCLSRDYHDLMLRAYNPDTVNSYFGPSYLYIPSSVRYISDGAFCDCVNLKTVILNEGLDSIGYAFWGCGLTEVHIPSSVRHIQEMGAFENCMSLKKITVRADNQVYDSRKGCNAIIKTRKDYMFITCQGTKIPDDVKRIKITNNVPKVRLGRKSQCEKLHVSTYTPKSISTRRSNALKSLGISFNSEQKAIKIRKVTLPAGLEYFSESRIDPDRIKGRMMKKSGKFNTDENYAETRSYIPEAKLLQIRIERTKRIR